MYVIFGVFLLILLEGFASGQHDCTYQGRNYTNLDTIIHDNECAVLQCQFGNIVIFYEACGKEIDGTCHRLNFMFEYQGHTYQCRKISSGNSFDYKNEISIPRIENCSVDGKIYQTQEKFYIGCRQYQCQNGEVAPLAAVCENEVDGRCHRTGEIFEQDGIVYICSEKEINGDTVYQNEVMDPQPTGNRACSAANTTLDNYEVFILPPVCHLRQCQNKRIRIIIQGCVFKRDKLKCYQAGQQWTYGGTTYQCSFYLEDQKTVVEIVSKEYRKCKRREIWYNHLDVQTRPDGCTSVQCQDGKTLPVQEGCLWNVDQKCYKLNFVWKNGNVALKCILTADGLYRVTQLDENGNPLDLPPPTQVSPSFGTHCPTLAADIIFVLDSSGSISSPHYKRLLDFCSVLISAFTIGPLNVRVGVVVFSGHVEKVFDLGKYDNLNSISEAIQNVPYLGDITETHLAFNLIVDDRMFSPEHGGRDNASNFVLIFTDGNSTNTATTLKAADRLKDQNVTIISVGIGIISKDELYGMASSPADVFNTSSYDEIFTLITQLADRTCQVIAPPAPPTQEPNNCLPCDTSSVDALQCPNMAADILFVLDASSGVGTENYALKLDLVASLVKWLTVSPDYVRVGVVVIGTVSALVFDLDDHQDGESVTKALTGVPYINGNRETQNALEIVLREGLFTEARGGREYTPNFVVLLIDGPSRDITRTISVAKTLRDQGTNIIAVGIDNYNQDELVAVSGGPRNVFSAASYRLFSCERKKLFERLCGDAVTA